MELHHIHHLEHHYGVCFQQGNVQSYHTRENVTCKQSTVLTGLLHSYSM